MPFLITVTDRPTLTSFLQLYSGLFFCLAKKRIEKDLGSCHSFTKSLGRTPDPDLNSLRSAEARQHEGEGGVSVMNEK